MTHLRKPLLAGILGMALALAACSSGGSGQSGESGGTASNSGAATTVTLRLWDEGAAGAYEESLAAFHEQNPDIAVEISVVPWSDYFTKLRTDIAAGSMDDLFWINNSSYTSYAKSGNMVNIDETLGAEARDQWDANVVKAFTLDDTLWGVPQLSDAGIALYYNKTLLDEAGVTPDDLANAKWSPQGGDDTLIDLLKKLTKDNSGNTADSADFNADSITQYGYNAAQDLQAIMLPFIGSNGGTFQNGDQFTFSDARTTQAMQYVVDLITKEHVAPSAADTNMDGEFTRNQFLQGNMAIFQSGLYNLATIAESADFEWGTALLPEGPAGRVSVTNGIVVAGNAKSENPEAVAEVLEWLGSQEGNEYIGKNGTNLPAVTAAQQVYFDFWKDKGIDIQPFFDVVADGAPTIDPPVGDNFTAASAAYTEVLNEVFQGRVPVAEGMKTADEKANAAMNGE